ncbi:MAG: hypothetical protein KJ052_07775 [Candidatus Hydrogenedentes bacterium]|nr:hypothetical protein [Candidatus Hydrogenedentota bacterium]
MAIALFLLLAALAVAPPPPFGLDVDACGGGGSTTYTLTTGVSGDGSVPVWLDDVEVNCDCFDRTSDNTVTVDASETVIIDATGAHCSSPSGQEHENGASTEYGFVEWDSDISGVDGDTRAEQTFTMAGDHYATAIFARPEITLTESLDGGGTIAEADEISRGAYAMINTDDDDEDGIEDYWDDYVPDEDDMVKVVIGAPSADYGGHVILQVVDTGGEEQPLRFWTHATKSADANGGGLVTTRSFTPNLLPVTLYMDGRDTSSDNRDFEVAAVYHGRDAVKITFINFAVSCSLEAVADVDGEYRQTFLSHTTAESRINPVENLADCATSFGPYDLRQTYEDDITWSYPGSLLHLQDPQAPTTGADMDLYADAGAAADGRSSVLTATITAQLTFDGITLHGETEIHQTDVDYVRQTYVDVTHTVGGQQQPNSTVPAKDDFMTEAEYNASPTQYLSWGELHCQETTHVVCLESETGLAGFTTVRTNYGQAIDITSFWRCARRNKAVGGARNSDHTRGLAFDYDNGSTSENWEIAYTAGQDYGPDDIWLYPTSDASNPMKLSDFILHGYHDLNLPTTEHAPFNWTRIAHGHVTTLP